MDPPFLYRTNKNLSFPAQKKVLQQQLKPLGLEPRAAPGRTARAAPPAPPAARAQPAPAARLQPAQAQEGPR